MKYLITICTLLALCTQNVKAQGIVFFTGTWKQLVEKAKMENKPIFMDVYTSWCGPCKKMARETFTQKEVGDYFNTHFINYQIDAEKGESVEIAKRYGVKAYPTCLFLLPDGKPVHSFSAYQNVKQILKQGQKAIENVTLLPELEKMEAQYQKGERGKDFLKQYCSKRMAFGYKGERPLNELILLLSDDELTDINISKLLLEANTYENEVMQKLLKVLASKKESANRKDFLRFDKTVMSILSNFLNEAIDNNHKKDFNELYEFKVKLDALEPSNQNNGMLASLGGGLAYMKKEVIQLTFFRKNNYREEFKSHYAAFIKELQQQAPADTLLKRSTEKAKSYSDFMNDPNVSEQEKKEQTQNYGFLQLLTGVSSQLVAGSLFSSWDYYWDNKVPPVNQREQAAEWLKLFYATYRDADLALPIADKLVEMGKGKEAKDMLIDLQKYLELAGDQDKKLASVKEKLQGL